ncbi:hypothetical protein GH714_004264 [Hevea brasiliensis]|uniref:DNA polymerase delta subunit 4 n=1 Tax=Hevea brasiliensis TaxID=3981 RepID=A0A6A6KGP4_HEVBR|nr:hypothetical protein GH714_004264 [Hevea brasiliensis]
MGSRSKEDLRSNRKLPMIGKARGQEGGCEWGTKVIGVFGAMLLVLIDDHDKHEELFRQFDMSMAYGPCLGMIRLARWERAQRLGLNPPIEIEGLMKDGKVNSDCLWDGRV